MSATTSSTTARRGCTGAPYRSGTRDGGPGSVRAGIIPHTHPPIIPVIPVCSSQGTSWTALSGQIIDVTGTGCQTIALDADQILPSDSYSQASEDGRTCFSYVSLLQRMNVKFQLITPETMDAIYRNIADEKKDPFEGIYTIRSTA